MKIKHQRSAFRDQIKPLKIKLELHSLHLFSLGSKAWQITSQVYLQTASVFEKKKLFVENTSKIINNNLITKHFISYFLSKLEH